MTNRIFIGGFLEPDLFGKQYFDMRRDFEMISGGKWVPLSNLHFTMQILGDVETEKIPQITTILKNYLCVHFGDLYIKGIGFFPHHRAPKILYARIHSPSGILNELHSEIEERLEPLGFKKEDRPFSPHITLKRVKDAEIYKIPAFLQKYAEIDFGIKPIFTLSLIESTLSREGSFYKAIHLPDSDFV
jgi:2'-5' RNA ligase